MAERSIISRSNLRDLIIVLSVVSSFFYNTNIISIIVGLVMLFLGCFIHFVTKGVLIRNTVLCSTGIYSIVRHPYYLANYLIDNSLCLISGNPYLLVIYPFLFFWAYGLTLRKEERLLGSIYNDTYFDYSLEVPQVFPDPKSLKNARDIFDGFSKKRITIKECSRIIRFWAVFIFIILVHHLKDKFIFSTRFFKEIEGIDKILAVVIIILYILSVLLLKKQKNNRKADSIFF
ncbi:MAG: hypothetical protein N3D15_05985 [Syntrophorhabdaceae bacterium]|nr:hypothetical protein [Syntrophorhabdaceae bacterium]